MALIYTPNPEQIASWTDWLTTRPSAIRDLAERFPPWRLYRDASGHRVTVCAYYADGTLGTIVTGQYNLVTFARKVFGVPPEELTECDLPAADEPLGEVLTQDEVEALMVDGRLSPEAVSTAVDLKLGGRLN